MPILEQETHAPNKNLNDLLHALKPQPPSECERQASRELRGSPASCQHTHTHTTVSAQYLNIGTLTGEIWRGADSQLGEDAITSSARPASQGEQDPLIPPRPARLRRWHLDVQRHRPVHQRSLLIRRTHRSWRLLLLPLGNRGSGRREGRSSRADGGGQGGSTSRTASDYCRSRRVRGSGCMCPAGCTALAWLLG